MSYRLGSDITLDQIDDWFKIGKTVSKVDTVSRSKMGGRELDPKTGKPVEPEPAPFVPPYKRGAQLNQLAYAEHYQQLEEEELHAQSIGAPAPAATGSTPRMTGLKHLSAGSLRGMGRGASLLAATSKMEDLEVQSVISGMTSLAPPEDIDEPPKQVNYDGFTFGNYDKNLPITSHHEKIVSTIESNQVTVIQGSTGSGKTTQVPQFILDHYARQSKYCNIIVTQPRRIAAMSIARRVCSERGWRVGGRCGYQVSLERCSNEDTRIMYVTTGVLKQKLINTKNMHDYTHVILDEVHERELESDLTLLFVRKLLRSNSRNVKVVLMSATIDSDLFARYFSVPVLGYLEPAPVVDVEGIIYAVAEYYVEQLHELGELPHLEWDNPTITAEATIITKKLIQQFDLIERQEQKCVGPTGFAPKRGSVLIFLPGIAEIEQIMECVDSICESHQLLLLPLHSMITLEEQARVFEMVPKGKRKIILSTNIAESSITVPDIKFVIDFCLTKNLQCDPDTNYTSLKLNWASRANSIQRKGRAGRVSNGRVYRMITRKFWQDYIPHYGMPEMQRCPLDKVVLEVKLLDQGEPKALLGRALSPPNLDDIERTILKLKEVGALSTLRSGAVNPHDGQLTFVGRVLAHLPVDVHVGKLLLLGHVFGLLQECLIIGACLSNKSFFARPFRAQLDAYRAKLGWASNSFSDCIAYLNAYKVWEENKRTGLFHISGQMNERAWCRRNMIQIRRIKEVEELVKELTKRLLNLNIKIPRTRHNDTRDINETHLILKVVLCGAFYPNYFTHCPNDEKDVIRSISGMDPCTTVMVKNLPMNQGSLYRGNIIDMFRCCCLDGKFDGKIHLEESRAYVEFTRHKMMARPGEIQNTPAFQQVLNEVYLAVKMRQLRIPLEIQLMDEEEARAKMAKVFAQQENRPKKLRTNRLKVVTEREMHQPGARQHSTLPLSTESVLQVIITHFIDCGHFWAQRADHDASYDIQNLSVNINTMYTRGCLKPIAAGRLRVGMNCIAPYEDVSKEYYRARIERINGAQVEVFFLDYGNSELVAVKELRELTEEFLNLPFQAIECFMINIRPSALKCPDGRWSDAAKRFFTGHVENKVLFAKVYSLVHGTMRVELIDKFPQRGGHNFDVNINTLLYERGFADKAEESYASKKNHTEREDSSINRRQTGPIEGEEEQSETASMTSTQIYDEENADDWLEISVPESSSRRRPGIKICLHGPYNPLELNYHSLTNVGRMRGSRIDRESVNSVAIDNEPEDKHQRLMVAAHVGLNPSGNTMMSRDTTLLPNIHGLYAIMAMLFSPNAELRTNSNRTHYIGALCGLGWDPDTGGSALPDNDMEITFDVHIDLEDIVLINDVKMAINMTLGSEDNNALWGIDMIIQLQSRAREKLLKLLEKRRNSIEVQSFNIPYQWNQVKEEYILPSGIEDTRGNNPDLLNLLQGIEVQDITDGEDSDTEKMILMRRQHVKWLRNKVSRSTQPEKILCELCDVICHNPYDLMRHLEKKTHQQEEALLWI